MMKVIAKLINPKTPGDYTMVINSETTKLQDTEKTIKTGRAQENNASIMNLQREKQ